MFGISPFEILVVLAILGLIVFWVRRFSVDHERNRNMFCPKCGNKLPDNGNCPSCGAFNKQTAAGWPAAIAQSFLVILALIIGAELAGFLGVILSVPVAATLQELVKDIESGRLARHEQEAA